ncbi:hypothetical protein CVT26_003015 [Gymnopilus dilepis]|uniref:Uncharacterized protein n=1 Tax=Gymnopilus dilepis TaxID=231916 RepID=A0A409W2H9_9AGAR|nr:hypothetical protein CVT26_003015 [Gymnopilus dilepis]
MAMSSEEPITKVDSEQVQASSSQEDYLETATERKQHGNDCFRSGNWNEALVAYQSALNCLPKRVEKQKTRAGDGRSSDEGLRDDEDGGESGKGKGKAAEETPGEDVTEISSPSVSEADKQVATLRAVLNANIGACYVKLGDHKEAVKACTEAIQDDPTYVKARERRAASNDILNTWTSLASVQEDYNALLELVKTPAYQADIRRKLERLKPRLEAAQKRETDEMLDKLKGLGNSILGSFSDAKYSVPQAELVAGNFGLSTDNFKFVPNGSGGYSVNFTR